MVYDASGQIVEVDGAAKTEHWLTQAGWVSMNGSTINRGFYPAPGGGTFYQEGTSTDYFMFPNWRGDAPIVSQVGANTVLSDTAFSPYGDTFATFGTTTHDLMFSGLQSTVGTAGVNFDTPNREFTTNQGRWLNPDPAGAGWNQYTYVSDPLTQTDPSGLVTFTNFDGLFFAANLGAGGLTPLSITDAVGTVGADYSNFFVNYNPNIWIGNGSNPAPNVSINPLDSMTGYPPDLSSMTCGDCLILQSLANEAEEINSQFAPQKGIVFPTGNIWDAFQFMSDSEIETAAKMYAINDDAIVSSFPPPNSIYEDGGAPTLQLRLESGESWEVPTYNDGGDSWITPNGRIGEVDVTVPVVIGGAGLAYWTFSNWNSQPGLNFWSYNSGYSQPTVSPNPPSYGLGCGLQCGFGK